MHLEDFQETTSADQVALTGAESCPVAQADRGAENCLGAQEASAGLAGLGVQRSPSRMAWLPHVHGPRLAFLMRCSARLWTRPQTLPLKRRIALDCQESSRFSRNSKQIKLKNLQDCERKREGGVAFCNRTIKASDRKV
jgi:hypothetical protein